jgi:outer membrane receptor protein involved in Fe transport
MNIRNNIPGYVTAAAIVVAGALSPAPARAQIEEIVVTTRRTEESLQEVPVAVSAFTAESIERQGLTTTSDVLKLVPGVQFDQAFSAADTRVSIRGINNTRGRTSVAILVDGVDVSGENVSAGGGSSLLNSRLLDLERVEVVKGPQSALYGRNAFGGAINYITRKPSMDGLRVNAYADVVANYSIYDVRGSISGPIIADKLAVSLNAGTYSSDGFYRNNNLLDPLANSELGTGENNGARLAMLWQPAANFSLLANVSYTENEVGPRAIAKIGNANTFYRDGVRLPAGTLPDYTFRQTGLDTPNDPSDDTGMDYGQWEGKVGSVDERGINLSRTERDDTPFRGSRDRTWLGYVKLDWEAGPVLLKSNSSILDNDAFLNEDVDFQEGFGTPIDRVLPDNSVVSTNFSLANDYLDETDTRYYSQEFTVESSTWDRGRWLVGVSGFWEDTVNTDRSLGWYNDPDFAAGFPNFCVAQQALDLACSYRDSARLGQTPKIITRDTTSYSAFGQLRYDLTDQWRVTAEIRYIRDDIEVSTNTSVDRVSQYVLAYPIDFVIPLDQLPTTDDQVSDTWNPRLTVDYRATDDVLVYASVAKGTKPAGFGTSQMAVPQAVRVGQEQLWAYELGTKTQWFDGLVQLNVAAFYNVYTDRQVGITVDSGIAGSSFPSAGVTNAGEVDTKGAEFDLTWRPIDPLTLAVGYAYVDAKFRDFSLAEARAQSNRPASVATVDRDRAFCGIDLDCEGTLVSGIPKHSLSAVANYADGLTETLDWFVNLQANWDSKRALDDFNQNTAFVDDLFLVDAQVGIQAGNWTAQVYADNLLDNDQVRWGQFYQDFRDGMYGGSSGGEPRDRTVFALLPPPRVVGIRATYRFGD